MPCHACQAAVTATDRFCPKCGQPLPQRPPRPAGQFQAVLGDFDVEGLTKLRTEKARLSAALQDMLDQIAGREMSLDERLQWEDVRERWRVVSEEITQQMEYFNARADFDRRAGDRRELLRRKQRVSIEVEDRRSGVERRHAERRDVDRRDPFETPGEGLGGQGGDKPADDAGNQ